MAIVSTLKDTATGTVYDIADVDARAAAERAEAESGYDRQAANNTYPGRNLATLFASEISKYDSAAAWLNARAKARNDNGMRIGDYFDIVVGTQTMRYRIGAMGHEYTAADVSQPWMFTMVPDSAYVIPASDTEYVVNGSYIPWNKTATNQGTADVPQPYLASNLNKYENEVILPRFPSAWQNVMRSKRSLVEHRYSASGVLTESTTWSWADLGKIWSPSEMEVYGCCIWGTHGYSQGMDTQFPIFAETKNRIKGRATWWLRSVRAGSSSSACYVNNTGYAGYGSAADDWLRPLPCFLVGV